MILLPKITKNFLFVKEKSGGRGLQCVVEAVINSNLFIIYNRCKWRFCGGGMGVMREFWRLSVKFVLK